MNSCLKSNNTTVSVAMTTCNGEKYLEEQLDSILAQTYEPHELVVGDDASTDSTVALLESFAQRASFPVRIIENKSRLGVLENFLHVFSQCQGQYISCCDQDDVWFPTKLEKCCTALIEHDAMLVSHRSQVVDSQQQPTGQLVPYGFPVGCYPFPHFPFCYWSHGHQMVFHRELLVGINYLRQVKQDSLARCQGSLDPLINIVAGMYGSSVFLSEPLIKFRRHANTVSRCSKKNIDGHNQQTKFEQRQRDLEEVVVLLDGLYEYLTTFGSDTVELGLDRRNCYLDFLKNRKEALSSRLMIYTEDGFAGRIRAYLSSVMFKAYCSPYRGGSGVRQAAIDSLVLFRILHS